MVDADIIQHLNNTDAKFLIEVVSVFIFSNLSSELIKYLGVKAFKKVDGMFHTFLDE